METRLFCLLKDQMATVAQKNLLQLSAMPVFMVPQLLLLMVAID